MPRTMTPAALAANRASALRSTGPRTVEGRAIAARNSFSHGIFSSDLIPPQLAVYESIDDYDEIVRQLMEEYRPQTYSQRVLVESIAASVWRMKRVHRSEAAYIAKRRDATRKVDAVGRPEPHPAIARLSAALASDPVDMACLRSVFAYPGSGREGYSDAALMEMAQASIAVLRTQHEAEVARWRELAELECSLPFSQTASRLARYAVELQRAILGTVRELRNQQAEDRARAVQPSFDDLVGGAGPLGGAA